MTVISTAFAPLARVTAEGVGRIALPIVVVPHPVGDRDEAVVQGRGAEIAAPLHAVADDAGRTA